MRQFLIVVVVAFCSNACLSQDEVRANSGVLSASPGPNVKLQYTTIDYPGARYTALSSINDKGDMVGVYNISGPNYFGFLYSGGIFSDVIFPGAVITQPSSINNRGVVVGHFTFADHVSHGFVYQSGIYTQLDYPGASITEVGGVNDAGVIVGTYVDMNQVYHGFWYSSGNFTQFDARGALATQIFGINNAGDTVGAWSPTATFIYGHGFLRTFRSGFRSFNYPFAPAQSFPLGLNSRRQIVGISITRAGTLHGFLALNNALWFKLIDLRGQRSTVPTGINESSVIVGSYTDQNFVVHGYVATPQ